MKKFRIGMIIVAVIAIIIILVTFDYGDLSWNASKPSYGVIMVMLIIIFNMIYSIRKDEKKLNEKKPK